METQIEKVSYIIGRQIGGDFKAQGIDVALDIFCESVKAAFNGEESKISAEETQSVMTQFQTEMQAKAQEAASAIGAENMKQGEEYLAKNKEVEGVQVTESGLQYKVVKAGEGKTPSAEDQVEVHYEGKLIDGTIFDSSYQRNQTATFPVNAVIPGWTEALQLMSEGAEFELTIPSNLAYGENGAGAAIAPNATLIFKVELVKVV